MLGIILLIFIGRSYLRLAKKFDKHQSWVYPILGIACYYAGVFLATGIILTLVETGVIDYFDEDNFFLTLLLIPMGLFSTWLVYYLLKRKWTREGDEIGYEILDKEF